MTGDWESIETEYGPATRAIGLLDLAIGQPREDAYDAVYEATAMFASSGFLHEAAPAFARELLLRAAGSTPNTAVFLFAVFRLLEPGAFTRGDLRAMPSDATTTFLSAWAERPDAPARAEQARRSRAIEDEVDALAPTLAERAAGDEEVLVLVAAVQALAGLAVEPTTDGRSWESQLAIRIAAGTLNRPWQVDGESAGEPDIRVALRTVLDPFESLRFPWIGGSVAFATADAVARSSLPHASRLLEEVVEDAENTPADDLSTYWTPAAAAGYWLVRRILARHWRQGVALGPGDMSSSEADALRRLAQRPGWGAGWASIRECGLLSFDHLDRVAGRIGDDLDVTHAGFFGNVWVTWPRWKWLANLAPLLRPLPDATAEQLVDATVHALLAAAPASRRSSLETELRSELAAIRRVIF